MEENKNIKIKFSTVATLISLIGIIILVILVSEFDTNIKTDNDVSIINENINQTLTDATSNTIEQIVVENMEDSFSFEFLKMENNKTNMIYSPLSIKYALSMLSEGASGNTKSQIDNVIGRLKLTTYKNIDKVLSLTNGIYIRDTYAKNVKESFRNTLVERYHAEVKYDAFANAKNVNSWIEDKTFGIIKNVLQDDIVTQSEMLLINALAIDMKWANEFDENDTYGKEFSLENGEKIFATTMNKETKSDKVSYYNENNITALTMDLKEYEDTQLEFMVIMPDKNLDEYIKTVTVKQIDDIKAKLTKASDTKKGIDISIPKFNFDYSLKLKEDLQKLGISDAFERTIADFSNISERNLYVDEAIHKANIKFSEEGIKAAAVTVFTMITGAIITEEEQPIEVKIDKPFMFLIRDKETGEIWFVGTVYEPNLWGNDKIEYQKNY